MSFVWLSISHRILSCFSKELCNLKTLALVDLSFQKLAAKVQELETAGRYWGLNRYVWTQRKLWDLSPPFSFYHIYAVAALKVQLS